VADVLDFLSLDSVLPSRKPLCIRAGEACWLLFVDVVVISVDGSLRGAIMEAVQQCFRNLKLPAMELPDGTSSTPVDLRPTKDAESLSAPTAVRCVTIAAISSASSNGVDTDAATVYLVVDPNSAEETVADGVISAVITKSTAAPASSVRVLSLSYHGGCAVSMAAVGECLKQYTF
jgi:exosome complex RNA-binding protein Rrp42 (RNase PH superfamily)